MTTHGRRIRRYSIGAMAAQAVVGLVPVLGFVLVASSSAVENMWLVMANWFLGANAAAGAGAAWAGSVLGRTSSSLVYATSAAVALGIEVGNWSLLSPIVIIAWVLVGLCVYYLDRHFLVPRRLHKDSGEADDEPGSAGGVTGHRPMPSGRS